MHDGQSGIHLEPHQAMEAVREWAARGPAAGELLFCGVGLSKLEVKGPAAESWLRGEGIDVPSAIFATVPLDGDGLVARLGSEDFVLERGPGDGRFAHLAEGLGHGPAGAYRIERQDSTFWLAGSRITLVMAQTCPLDLRRPEPNRILLTRLAGVSCGILTARLAQWPELPLLRLWVDPSYAVYISDTLAAIVRELGGVVIEGRGRPGA